MEIDVPNMLLNLVNMEEDETKYDICNKNYKFKGTTKYKEAYLYLYK